MAVYLSLKNDDFNPGGFFCSTKDEDVMHCKHQMLHLGDAEQQGKKKTRRTMNKKREQKQQEPGTNIHLKSHEHLMFAFFEFRALL